ncbi:MAG: ATP-grasp domain-containing protein [Bacteroidales bacterium]|nr:ATP-grasp domain-containing protein [Bacteroidales bacterium]
MNILLTSVGRRTYLVNYFKEALADCGLEGSVHVSNSSSMTPAFKFADHSVVSPLIYAAEYIPFLTSYCKQNNIDILIPLFDVDLPVLAKNTSKFDAVGTKVIVSSESVIDICNDKLATYDFLISEDFCTPFTMNSIIATKKALNTNKIEFPLIIKPRWGMGSIGIFEANNMEELEVLYDKTLLEIKGSYLKYEAFQDLSNSVIIQEKIDGQEYGLDIINDLSGKYITTIVKKKHAMRSGETDCAEIVKDNSLELLGKHLGESLKHIGNLDVDIFIKEGKSYILEMNARFGGGYPFSHVAGVNLPKAILHWYVDKNIPIESLLTPKYGVLAHKDISMVVL